jgi:hypothetical protein
MAKIKARRIEAHNHDASNPAGTAVTPETALPKGKSITPSIPEATFKAQSLPLHAATSRRSVKCSRKGRTYVWRMLGFIEYANKTMAKPFK